MTSSSRSGTWSDSPWTAAAVWDANRFQTWSYSTSATYRPRVLPMSPRTMSRREAKKTTMTGSR